MKSVLLITCLFLMVSFSFASKTQPQKIEGKDGDKYILPGHDVTSSLDKTSRYILERELEVSIKLTVMERRFIEEFPEFQDREELERSNDEN
jgi:hypothetical protein